jgi:hypothetical protein
MTCHQNPGPAYYISLNRKSDGHLGFEIVTEVVVKSPIVWDIMSCGPLMVSRRFGVTCKLSACFVLVSFLVHAPTSKMEVKCSSEMSVDFRRTT